MFTLKQHIEAALTAVIVLMLTLGVVAYRQEHAARILAEQTVKTAQVQIDALQKQSAAAAQAGQVQITKLQAQAKAVKTPAQAITALELDPALRARPAFAALTPDGPPTPVPDAVTVEAVPLFAELNQCKQDAVNLGVCSTKLNIAEEVGTEKDTQIKALKKKKGFWARVKKDVIDTTVTVGIGIALGYVAHR